MTSFAFTALTVAAGNLIKTRCCFKEGTLVETENGLKPIEEIEVGDKVLAYDETTGEQAYKPVVQLFRNTTKEWYHIHAGGEEIICTGGHPFYVASLDKFIPARELKVGSTLLLSDGSCVIIEEIKVEKLSTSQTTYNFEVADFHTYYVSDSKILVHNKCSLDSLTPEQPQPPDKITGYTKHGLESAMGHNGVGVKPSAILDAVKNPIKEVAYDATRETFKYVGKGAVVVLNRAGEVVTTYAKSSAYVRVLGVKL